MDYTSTNGQSGTLLTTHSNGFSYIDFNTMTKITVPVNGSGMPTLKDNGFQYNLPYFEELPTDYAKAFSAIDIYPSCWIASPWFHIRSSDADYGFYYLEDGSITCESLYDSLDREGGLTSCLCAVVFLSPDIQIGEKDDTLGWAYEV